MILIAPFLLITLHFSQIGFTDDLTFMLNPPFIKRPFYIIACENPICKRIFKISQKSFDYLHIILFTCHLGLFSQYFVIQLLIFLFISPNNSPFRQIVWGELQSHFIPRKDTDEVLAKLAADMCKNFMTVFQFNLEHRVWKLFDYSSFDFNNIGF